MIFTGKNNITELLRSEHKVTKIYLDREKMGDTKLAEIITLAQQMSISIAEKTDTDLTNLTGNERHQGVIAEVQFLIPQFTSQFIENQEGFYIYIREAQDPHNVGAIIRTAEAAGIAGVILPPKLEITDTIARTSAGAIFHQQLYSASLFPTMKEFSKMGMKVSAIEIDGDKTLYESDLLSGLIVVGGEDRSISTEVANKCDQVIKIPQQGKVNSLNMSVAAAVVMYEHVRQINHQ